MIRYNGKNYKIKLIGKYFPELDCGNGEVSFAFICGKKGEEFPEEGDIIAILEEIK